MRIPFLTIAVLACLGSAQAGTVVVTDSGNIGDFRFTNMGIVGTTAIIVADLPEITSQLNTVNGDFVSPVPVSVNGPITLLVTPSGGDTYNVMLSPGDYIKTIGVIPGAEARLSFNLTTGEAPTTLRNFFNTSGPVTSVLENDHPLYDFSLFANPGGMINFTFTATAYSIGTRSFADLFSTVGAVATGNGSFSQSAVPEPASAALLGIGLCILFALRRFRS